MPKRIFSYEEAIALLPEVQRLTAEAVERVEEMTSDDPSEYESVVEQWAATRHGVHLMSYLSVVATGCLVWSPVDHRSSARRRVLTGRR